MFGTTCVIGMLASSAFGLFVQIFDPELKVTDLSLIFFNIYTGVLYSVLCQLGFFAYMTLNYIALDIFRRKTIWIYVQWICIVLAFGYLVGIRTLFFTENNRGVLAYSVLPAVLFAASWVVAWYKTKLTNRTAFTPTLFFMFVVTSIEAVPALRQNDPLATLGMAIPLFACNAWLILNLHKYVKRENLPAGEPDGKSESSHPKKKRAPESSLKTR